MSAAIVAFGAVSALGEGDAAISAGVVGEAAHVAIRRDAVLEAAGLARPFAARVDLPGMMRGKDDAASLLLRRALLACVRDLDACMPGWRALRVGLALGTSSGGMQAAETLFETYAAGAREPDAAEVARALYFGPVVEVMAGLALSPSPATLVMGACAASTLAVGVGMRWLEADACDVALVGGFDGVSTLVAAGFEVLRATTATPPPRPFRKGRDGMALGEGAAVVALCPARSAGALVYVTGFGATSDAVHLTAPDRTGHGLGGAGLRALVQAGVTEVDLVSPHGSATPFSDAAEVEALRGILPGGAEGAVVHPFKAQIGHTLGASGVLEMLACVDALRREVLPAAAGGGEIDPEARAELLPVTRTGQPRTALKLSAAFGGANAALVLSRAEPPSAASTLRPVYLRSVVHVTALPTAAHLAERLLWPVERVLRAEPLSRWVLHAIDELGEREGALEGAGIVVGEAFATMDTDAAFFARMQQRGVRMAEPRKFPYTSPNAAAGDAGVAFGLTGPSFAVGLGLHAGVEALVVASQLVAAGDADTMVVVAADEVGPTVARMAERLGVTVEAGAVALVVSREPGTVAVTVTGSCGLSAGSRAGVGIGHRALLPLLTAPLPHVVEAVSPSLLGMSGWARVSLAGSGIDVAPLGP